MQKNDNQKENPEVNAENKELDLEELEQVSGGGLRNVRIDKTKDVTDSIKKRI